MTPQELLAFEARWPQDGPMKRHVIRRDLGMSEIRFYQLLRRAASSTEGIAAHPITARMVRERSAAHAAGRASRTA